MVCKFIYNLTLDLHNAVAKMNLNSKAKHHWASPYTVSVIPIKYQAMLVGSSDLLPNVDFPSISLVR